MSNTNGIYGTKRPAMIDPQTDCDIFYYYRPDRSSESSDFSTFKELDRSNLTNSEVTRDGSVEALPGMYNLRLPLSEFKEKGIYTLYIKPIEVKGGKIYDISTLTSHPEIKGIILDASEWTAPDTTIFENGGLVGYRIEYFDNGVRTNFSRIITSNNKCEPVPQNLIDTSQTGVSYRFNNSSNFIFCTVSPSTSLSFKSTDKPDIGTKGQEIRLINTKFNPFMVEIEMTEHDIETVSTMLEGKQIRNLDKATITTFNKQDGIYHQAVYGNILNANTGINHDFKIPMKDSVDFNEQNNLEEIENNI